MLNRGLSSKVSDGRWSEFSHFNSMVFFIGHTTKSYIVTGNTGNGQEKYQRVRFYYVTTNKDMNPRDIPLYKIFGTMSAILESEKHSDRVENMVTFGFSSPPTGSSSDGTALSAGRQKVRVSNPTTQQHPSVMNSTLSPFFGPANVSISEDKINPAAPDA